MANEDVKTGFETRELTIDNLHQYQDLILASEEVFHPELREDLEGIVEILSSNGAIGKVACLDGRYIGNALGFSPTEEQIQDMELFGVEHNPGSVYLSNFVIDHKLQGRGYGTALLMELIKACRERGYKSLEGHFRDGSSLHVAKKLGAREIETFPNWFDSGEDYIHCKIDWRENES